MRGSRPEPLSPRGRRANKILVSRWIAGASTSRRVNPLMNRAARPTSPTSARPAVTGRPIRAQLGLDARGAALLGVHRWLDLARRTPWQSLAARSAAECIALLDRFAMLP